MTSIENEIFTNLKALILAQYSTAYVSGEYTPTPPKFPCVFISENDNYTISMDGSNQNEVSGVMYEINVFSNKTSGRKTQCKNIIKIIDDYMTIRGFSRSMCQPTPNEDTSVYRITARYTASILNNIIYRR